MQNKNFDPTSEEFQQCKATLSELIPKIQLQLETFQRVHIPLVGDPI